MSLLAHFRKDEPFFVEVGELSFSIPNINSLPLLQVYALFNPLRNGGTFGTLFRNITGNSDFKKLTLFQARDVFELWMEYCDLTIGEIFQTFDVIDGHETALLTDLHKFTNYKSIDELLKEDIRTITRTIQSILTNIWRESHLFAELQDWMQPYHPLHNIEKLLHRLDSNLVNVQIKGKYESVFPKPDVKETDTFSETFEPKEDEGTPEENDAILEQWRSQGTFTANPVKE